MNTKQQLEAAGWTLSRVMPITREEGDFSEDNFTKYICTHPTKETVNYIDHDQGDFFTKMNNQSLTEQEELDLFT
jgi:hypothetical protein